jgi:hypothetical protein
MTGRRSFLAIGTATALAASASVNATEAGDARLLAACDAFLKVDRELKTWVHPPSYEAASDAANEAALGAVIDNWYAGVEFITELQPTTPRGVQAKIRAACAAMETIDDGNGLQREEALGLSALRAALEGAQS